jgi:hypothetical protein
MKKWKDSRRNMPEGLCLEVVVAVVDLVDDDNETVFRNPIYHFVRY